MVTGDSLLKYLFRPDEVDMLVCGSKVLFTMTLCYTNFNFLIVYNVIDPYYKLYRNEI